MSKPAAYLALQKVEFDYEATTEDEISVKEEQLVWVMEDDDPDWFKVKVKSTDLSPVIGLVPASYLGEPTRLRTVRAVYDYAPAVTDSGELENEEEMEITEGEVLVLWADEGDWVLVGREGAKGVGFVPGTYIEDADVENGAHDAEPDEPEESAVAPTAYVDPSERVAASKAVAKSGDVKTWPVTEIDKKKKKRKGTLGVGNGAVFFASDSDKTPVQQYPLSTLEEVTSEKSKHLHLTFPTVGELHFVIGSTEVFNEIMAKIDEGRSSSPTSPAAMPAPPPPPPAPAAPSLPANGAYIPPPPPVRSDAPAPITSHPVPPTRAATASSTLVAQKGDASALYDFVAEGEDELPIVEGERLIFVEGGSDDPDWVKVKKADGSAEGVVPASYIQMDDDMDAGATEENSEDDEAARAAAEAEAQADAQDKARLAAELRDAERARRAKVAVDREAKEKKAQAEAARQKRLSEQPKAAPIPIPDRHQLNESPPPLAARPREGGSSRSSKPPSGSKPSSKRVRTWKDRTGQFKVEAEFLGMNGHKIRLHKLNGVTIEVPMEKMSAEDQAYLKKINTRSGSSHVDDSPAMQEERRNRHHFRAEQAASSAGRGEQSSSRPSSSTAKPKRKATDWFDFFLAAGCDVDDCTRYGNNFEREKIEESLVGDLEASTLRSLGLREGDIIRVIKLIKEKYGPPPTPEKGDREAQVASDAAMARQLAGPTPPPPNLFTNADGNLKTRRGRPTPNRQGTSGVDAAALLNAGSELTKRVSTPPISRVASPPVAAVTDHPKRSSSTIPQLGGFDDDAWTVKGPSPSVTPTPPAPAPAPAPTLAPPKPPTPPPVAAPSAAPQRSGSAGANEGLTYNDGLLAQIGVGIGRSPSAPATSSGGTGYGNHSSVPAFNPNAPRGPILPTAQNQALLAPLVPTQTGFQPRSQFGQGGLMPQMTGYAGQVQLIPAFTGMSMQSQAPQFTGTQAPSPMQMQPTGFQQPQQMQMQPTGFQPQQQSSFLQPQPTGFMQPQGTGIFQNPQQQQYNPTPARFSPAPPPIQFNPTPPPSHTAAASSTTEQFKPNNIFASMKDGSFGNNSSQLGPQNPNKYDALRPQATGFPQQGLQPQMTGAYGILQPQQTGFPGQQQQPVYPQQTGMYNQFQQRQF